MKKLKLYVETSVWSFLFDDENPEKKAATEQFFKEVESEKYEIFISETVIAEIRDAPDEIKRECCLNLKEWRSSDYRVWERTLSWRGIAACNRSSNRCAHSGHFRTYPD